MMGKGNALNIIKILVATLILLAFTIVSGKNVEGGMFSMIFNIIFLVMMFIIILKFVFAEIRCAIELKNDFNKFTKKLMEKKASDDKLTPNTGNQKNFDWKDISFANSQLNNAFLEYINETKRLSKDKIEFDDLGCDIDDYINIKLLNGIIKKSVCESISGSMTGLGILGTFLGLIIGLKDFSIDYEGIQNSILMLLNGIKTAFLTSIYGVVYSILFNWIFQKAYSEMSDALNEFKSVLNSKSVHNTQNNMKLKFVSTQDKIIEILGNNSAIISTSTNNLTEQFKESMMEMTKNIKNYLENLNINQQEQLKTMVREYLVTMNKEILGGQFEEMRTTLSKINEANELYYERITSLSAKIEDSGNSFVMMSDRYHEIVCSFQQYVNQLGGYQQAVTTANDHLTKNMEALTVRYDAQNQQNENLNKLMERQAQLNEQLENSINDSVNNNKQFTQSTEELIRQVSESNREVNEYAMQTAITSKNVAEELTTYTKENMEESVKALSDMSATFASASENISTMYRNLTEDMSTKFTSTSENIDSMYNNLTENVADGLCKSFKAFDHDTAEIVRRFSDTLEAMKETMDSIPDKLYDSVNSAFVKFIGEQERVRSIARTREKSDDNIDHENPEPENPDTEKSDD